MKIISEVYLEALKTRDFFLLGTIVFLYQAATAFILLALILSVYEQTGSNFGVSGVILSFAVPGFFLMAVSGFVSDLVDRRTIIIGANVVLALVLLLILSTISKVHTSIFLSFIYFSANSLLLPATSAAIPQTVPRGLLLAANSIFIFTLVGGQFAGFFVASIIIFFLGSIWTLVVCEILILIVIWLAFLLPPLSPRKDHETLLFKIIQILEAFIYVLKRRVIWFFFIAFAFAQGLIAFGVTLAPGFFNNVVGLATDKSPIVMFPLLAIGVALGAIFVHNPKIRESSYVALGIGVIGGASLALGILLKSGLIFGRFLLLPIGIFLPALGFGIIISQIVCRAVLSRSVANRAQGTVFGALAVLAAFFAAVMAPLAASMEALVGYVNILFFGGIVFVGLSAVLVQVGRRWKF